LVGWLVLVKGRGTESEQDACSQSQVFRDGDATCEIPYRTTL